MMDLDRTVDLDALRDCRARDPRLLLELARARRRRPLLRADGRLLLVAADHPARGAISVGDDPLAMGSRETLLRRTVTALSHPGVDGVLGTADVLDDLLLLGALHDKVVIGSMNRGGLAGAVFELDDRFTGYDAEHLASSGFDGGKMLARIDYGDPASVRTLEACAHAVGALAGNDLVALVEPFISRRVDGRLSNDLSTEAVVRSVAIASGLGATSRTTWLKLPVVDGMEKVMAATTLPTVLLGGDPKGPATEYRERWRDALGLPGVRGLVVGRALLYPSDGDVAGAVDAAVRLVHPTHDEQKGSTP